MPFKSWLLKKEKQSFLFRYPLMVSHLLKESKTKRVSMLLDSLLYFFRYSQWRLTLSVIRPLNYVRESSWMIVIRKFLCKSFGKHYYEVSMPLALEERHKYLFLNNFYVLNPLKIRRLNDYCIYMTGDMGIAFKKFKILPESIHGKWDKRNVILLRDYFPLVMDPWMYGYYSDTGGILRVDDDKKYLLIHHWFNYYHWLTETVLRLWVIRENINDYIVLLPEDFRQIQFVQLSLEALNVRHIQYVKPGTVIRAKDLTIVQNKPYCGRYFSDLTKPIGKFLAKKIGSNIPDPGFGEKIFISRKKVGRRKLVNEGEVEKLLSEFGFKSLIPEELGFQQQVAVMSRAKYLVCMHGAGLTNMLFMPEGSSILELHREIYSRADLHSDIYWKLASALGHSYRCQFCTPSSQEEDFFTVDYIVDVEKLKGNLDGMLADKV